MKADEFRALARDTIADTADPDPAVIAEKIAGQLSDEDCRVALGVILAGWVRVYSATLSRSARSAEIRDEPAVRDELTGKPLGSARVRRVRDWHARVLASSLFNGEEWKFLRDCTWRDLAGAADQRRTVAEQTQAEARRWSALADLMKRKRYATAADIPADALRAALANEVAA